jgi:hypothetical protein
MASATLASNCVSINRIPKQLACTAGFPTQVNTKDGFCSISSASFPRMDLAWQNLRQPTSPPHGARLDAFV